MPDEKDIKPGDGADEELDSAAEILANEVYEVTDEFLERVRAKIHRRTAAAQVSSFSWRVPGLVLLELVRFLGFMPQTLRGGGDRWKSGRG